MRRLLLAVAGAAALLIGLIAGHLTLIEAGREVVVLGTRGPDGGWLRTRLWVVDDATGAAWLHSAGPQWVGRFADGGPVELTRDGETRRYRATPVPGPHPEIDALLRAKYGVADVWVRFLAPCDETTVPVRLDPVNGERPGP